MADAESSYQAVGFMFFVRNLRSGLAQRLEHFERDNKPEFMEVTKTPAEWMEFYRQWSVNNQNAGLNDLIKAFLGDMP